MMNDISRRGFLKAMIGAVVAVTVPTVPALGWREEKPEEFTVFYVETFRLETFGYGTRGLATHKNGESCYFALKHEMPEPPANWRELVAEHARIRFKMKYEGNA
ncbi:MAG: hypothetical protein C4586_08380 [Anaerolineaceae bacterium]|nr:MAG: hypothetical protein C4586_08380 [Anaerolineaceae bacterium]